jgi:RNA polymerase sigma-70 factor, ECF subfamily
LGRAAARQGTFIVSTFFRATLPPLPASDLELCARLRRGDLKAFEELFVAHHAMLCEIVDAYVSSQATAEEIVQDLFYTIWRDRAALAVRGSFRAYLCVAARNRAFQHLRHRAVAQRWAHLARADPDVRSPSGAEGLERRESLEALRHAIAALPARARLAVVLRWRHQMSNAAVAQAMGISVKGVEKLLASAMKRLRSALRAHGDGVG